MRLTFQLSFSKVFETLTEIGYFLLTDFPVNTLDLKKGREKQFSGPNFDRKQSDPTS